VATPHAHQQPLAPGNVLAPGSKSKEQTSVAGPRTCTCEAGWLSREGTFPIPSRVGAVRGKPSHPSDVLGRISPIHTRSGAHSIEPCTKGMRLPMFRKRWPAVFALLVNLAFSFYVGSHLLFGADHGPPGDLQGAAVDDERQLGPGLAARRAFRASGGRRRTSRRSERSLHKPPDDEDAGLAKKELLKVTGGREHPHTRPDMHVRCTDPKMAVHVVYMLTRREFAAAAASAFSILRHASRPEAVYFHFVVPAGARTDGLCARLRLYSHTFPEHFCRGRHGGLRSSVQLMHMGGTPSPAAPPKPPGGQRGHAANESAAWSLHRASQESSAKRALLDSSPLKRIGGKLSDMRMQAAQHLQMARKMQPVAMPYKQAQYAGGKPKGGAPQLPQQQKPQGKQESKASGHGREQFHNSAVSKPSGSANGVASKQGEGSEGSGRHRVELPQCSGWTDTRVVKRDADHALEVAERARQLSELEEKLARCTVVPELQNYTYRNATDCERPESLEGMVKPVRLVGWEDEDILDGLFEVGRPCSCGFAQADVFRFNLSQWVDPEDVVDSPAAAGDGAALVSYAKVFLDDLLLPWGVPAAVVLEPDTLVTGDIGALWNSSRVTKRHTAKGAAAAERDEGNSQVWVQADRLTEIDELPEKPSVQSTFLAAVKDCTVPQSKVYSFKSFTVSRLIQHNDCSVMRGVFLLDVEAYAANHMQVCGLLCIVHTIHLLMEGNTALLSAVAAAPLDRGLSNARGICGATGSVNPAAIEQLWFPCL